MTEVMRGFTAGWQFFAFVAGFLACIAMIAIPACIIVGWIDKRKRGVPPVTPQA